MKKECYSPTQEQIFPAMAAKLIFLTFVCVATVSCFTSRDEEGLYVNEWAVKVAGGERKAREVATDHGFTFDGQVRNTTWSVWNQKSVNAICSLEAI